VAATNVYFDLTREFNARGPIAALASGQAVVFYRLAIMSKDGDFLLDETDSACARVLDVLASRKARYRPGAPLDIRWLPGGWSSHLEYFDDRGRRIRCDFFTRAPRVDPAAVRSLFAGLPDPLIVIGVEPLIHMKRTQRAKDHAVIGELARLLPPEREIELTTDPDRVVALAKAHGARSARPCVRAAVEGRGRDEVVVAMAREVDRFRRLDRERVQRYARASDSYLREFGRLGLGDLSLPAAHGEVCGLAERLLPTSVPGAS